MEGIEDWNVEMIKNDLYDKKMHKLKKKTRQSIIIK